MGAGSARGPPARPSPAAGRSVPTPAPTPVRSRAFCARPARPHRSRSPAPARRLSRSVAWRSSAARRLTCELAPTSAAIPSARIRLPVRIPVTVVHTPHAEFPAFGIRRGVDVPDAIPAGHSPSVYLPCARHPGSGNCSGRTVNSPRWLPFLHGVDEIAASVGPSSLPAAVSPVAPPNRLMSPCADAHCLPTEAGIPTPLPRHSLSRPGVGGHVPADRAEAAVDRPWAAVICGTGRPPGPGNPVRGGGFRFWRRWGALVCRGLRGGDR